MLALIKQEKKKNKTPKGETKKGLKTIGMPDGKPGTNTMQCGHGKYTSEITSCQR